MMRFLHVCVCVRFVHVISRPSLYLCVFVCATVCVGVYVVVYMFVYMFVYMYEYLHVCMGVCVYVGNCVCVRVLHECACLCDTCK